MQQTMRYLLICLLPTLGTTSFAQTNNNTQLAQNSARTFLNAIKNMDLSPAKEYGTENTAKMLEMMSSFTSVMPDSIKIKALKIEFEITEIELNTVGDKATVSFIGSNAPHKTEKIKLVKFENKWLADLKLPQAPQIEELQRQEPIRKED